MPIGSTLDSLDVRSILITAVLIICYAMCGVCVFAVTNSKPASGTKQAVIDTLVTRTVSGIAESSVALRLALEATLSVLTIPHPCIEVIAAVPL